MLENASLGESYLLTINLMFGLDGEIAIVFAFLIPKVEMASFCSDLLVVVKHMMCTDGDKRLPELHQFFEALGKKYPPYFLYLMNTF